MLHFRQHSRNTLLGPGQCIRNSHRHYLPGKDTIQAGCLVWDDLQITDDGRSIKLSRKAIMENLTMEKIIKNSPDLTEGCGCVDCDEWRKAWGVKPYQNTGKLEKWAKRKGYTK